MTSLTVKVYPNRRKTALLKEEDDVLHIALNAPPEDNKANKELERFLTKHTGKKATITTGFTSRKKRVRLS